MKRKPNPKFGTSGAEDILTVAYRLEQCAMHRDKENLRSFIPTSQWMREQAAILRKALSKEDLDA